MTQYSDCANQADVDRYRLKASLRCRCFDFLGLGSVSCIWALLWSNLPLNLAAIGIVDGERIGPGDRTTTPWWPKHTQARQWRVTGLCECVMFHRLPPRPAARLAPGGMGSTSGLAFAMMLAFLAALLPAGDRGAMHPDAGS